ncbi:Protein of unknown function YGGT [Candidatus Magnetoovum chiemensis]|nr:Protein of unknown function YGGT [Candidatus Magnetoovum chiemensis]
MFVLSNLINATATVLELLLNFYMWIIIISAFLSWVNPDPYNIIVRFLHSATEPVLRPIRRRLGIFSGFDLSPLIVILVIVFLRTFLIATLRQLAARLS